MRLRQPALLWSGCGCRLFYSRLGRRGRRWFGCSGSALGDDDMNDFDRPIRAIVGIPAHACDLFHQSHAGLVALAEDGVSTIQAGIWDLGDEELGAVGVRTSVGVGQASGSIKLKVGEVSFLKSKPASPLPVPAGSPP